MSKCKKSQSIGINTIIIAAIALAVLVVTFIIFTGQSSSITKTLQSCESKNGVCAETSKKNNNNKVSCNDLGDEFKEYKIPMYINDPACGESKLCCLKIG